MSAHTPGPWIAHVDPNPVGGQRFACITSEGEIVRRIADVVLFDERAEADARLIAAAPDLIGALEPGALEVIADEIAGDSFRRSSCAESLRAIAKQQRAAIAKAEGRP